MEKDKEKDKKYKLDNVVLYVDKMSIPDYSWSATVTYYLTGMGDTLTELFFSSYVNVCDETGEEIKVDHVMNCDWGIIRYVLEAMHNCIVDSSK